MSELVERAKAALEGVTEEGWLCGEDPCGCYSVAAKPDLTVQVVAEHIANKADAEFIAAARSLVPELVAEVESMLRTVDGLRSTLFLIREARIDYDAALRRREHGGAAARRFVDAVVSALDGSDR